ncbi:LOW QUALITY PROTEIN: uncharacterized protein WCC33_010960 [Rhinophrynus dorsalis]
MSRSVTLAIQSAMGMMSSNTAESISSALKAAQVTSIQDRGSTVIEPAPATVPSKKSTHKARHIDNQTSNIVNADSVCTVKDGVVTPHKGAQYWAKLVHKWKKARALGDILDLDSDSEEVSDRSEKVVQLSEADDVTDPQPIPLDGVAPNIDDQTLLDPQGEPLFDRDNILHPRSADWFPMDHVAIYLARKPSDKVTSNKLRAECPRPIVPDMVSNTPDVDPKISQFLSKSGWKPKKGLDYSLRNCQDKIFDILGSCIKIFEIVEAAVSSGGCIDPLSVRGWIQRAICLIGNANTALAMKRCKAILLRIEPKLINLATSEPGPQAKGLLCLDNFVKELGSFVQPFMALDKAQSNMKRVFSPKVFPEAGRGRGRLPGQVTRGPSHGSRGPNHSKTAFQKTRPATSPFFPQRGCPWQTRGARGSYQTRQPYGKCIHSSFFPYRSRGQITGFQGKLVQSNHRPVGPTNCVRLPGFLSQPVQDCPPHVICFSPQDRELLLRRLRPFIARTLSSH